MRGPLVLLVLLAIIAGGGFLLHQTYEIQQTQSGWTVTRRATRSSLVPDQPPVRSGPTIRIASFNIQVFGQSKLEKPYVMEKLAEVVRQFDVVAIQEIRSRNQDVIPQFVELINAPGRHYDYVIGPRLGRTTSKEQYAFVFDKQTVEVDRNQLYTIDDPDDLLHRPPLVGWFRTRGPPEEAAFTFSLVNIHTDPDEVKSELGVLENVVRAVHADGRQEDDIIILGDFNADHRMIIQSLSAVGVTCAIQGVPTNLRRTAEYDNLVFQDMATDEFTGRVGVIDFLRQYNLTLDAAAEISDHFPVFAEFSVHEGGQPGRIANKADGTRRQ